MDKFVNNVNELKVVIQGRTKISTSKYARQLFLLDKIFFTLHSNIRIVVMVFP